MTRIWCAGAAVLWLAACGGADGAGVDGAPTAEVVTSCDIPEAGQCATVETSRASWDAVGGLDAWTRQCASGASGHAGTITASCPVADRVGRCTVSYASGTSSAVVTYGYYAPTFTSAQAVQTCAAISGRFADG